MKNKKIFTIPNILSVFRILLAILFFDIYIDYGLEVKRTELILILCISGLTDFLDGKIARRFNMISELGKILDPIADKLTQCVLLICFLHKYDVAKYVFVVFLVKEIYMGIAGLKTISVTGKNEGAMWYGKVSTAVFYLVMILLFCISNIPEIIAECMLVLCGILMLMSLLLYANYYKKLQTEAKKTRGEKR